MQKTKLKIGMPAGSLANINRGGNLIKLLEEAGFKTKGYEHGGPSSFTTVNYLFGWDGRPQEFGAQLGIGELDIAIAGDDWIKERVLELKLAYNTEINIEKVLSLKRGRVKLVGIVEDKKFDDIYSFLENLCSRKKLITVVTEMPYITLNWLHKSLKKIDKLEEYSDFSVQKYKTPSRIQKGLLIYETWGKTEAKIKNEGADLGLEITQSGSSIKNYELKIIDVVMDSETGIYINPEIVKDEQKKELLQMFLINLYGVVNAENKVIILFNVPNSNVREVEEYLSNNNLFADEPTVNIGKSFTEFSIQVDTTDIDIPIAMIRYELAKRNAVNIDTIPIESSIPNLNVLGL